MFQIKSIPKEWNLSLLLPQENKEQIEDNLKKVKTASYKFIKKWKSRSDYLETPQVLAQALDEYESWSRSFAEGGAVGYYFWLKSQQDQNDPKIKAESSKIEQFTKKIKNEIQFFELNIAKIPVSNQKLFLNHQSLKNYQHFLERLFNQAKYLLSEPEEKILNLKSTPAHTNWAKMLSGFLAKEERIVLDAGGKKQKKIFSEISSLMDHKDKKIRDIAAAAYNDILNSNSDIAEAEINSILLNKKIDDELRNFSRPDLSRHITDDIGSEVVDSLISVVTSRFTISQRFYKLKSKLLGLKKLSYHERNIEYGKANIKYSFSRAAEMVNEVLENLDPEFSKIFLNFLSNGQIDIYPKKGKRMGAFCSYWLITHPIFILLNYTDKLNDVLTLAHEVGHGINDELMRAKQNSLSFDTSLSTAEVASTFMEDFVLQKILSNADDQIRLEIMMLKLNDDISTIFRQIACYNFENALHGEFRSKGYLSKEQIGKLFQKHMGSYMGQSVDQSPGSENWWIHWWHIRTFFYNYSYASGLLISKSLQAEVKKDPTFINKVKDFLASGTSDSPKNIFKQLGIDITDQNFWNLGLDEIEQLLTETTKLARKLGKL